MSPDGDEEATTLPCRPVIKGSVRLKAILCIRRLTVSFRKKTVRRALWGARKGLRVYDWVAKKVLGRQRGCDDR